MNYKSIILLILSILQINLSSGQNKSEGQNVLVIIQPEVEINKDFDIFIVFKIKPDSIWIVDDKIENVNFTKDLNQTLKGNLENIELYDESKFLSITTNSGKPNKSGKLTFPAIYYRIKDSVYCTLPLEINVVKELEINEDAIFLKLKTDKEEYGLADTIKLQLFEYSKFTSQVKLNSRQYDRMNSELNQQKILIFFYCFSFMKITMM